jgi:uncharacterized protein DUF4062
MTQRKLQVFLSSTYEDLIDQRLAAMEAVLAAGHIPAAMEQFSPGDETAWEKIRIWIDSSDCFILILGGRYGSIEPNSGKSYVQLEYEYAIEQNKPFFALVVDPKHHEERVKQFGLQVDEREHQALYQEFRDLVTERVCGFWSDRKDIQTAIFQKLPEWMQRPELVGWIRADQAPSSEVTSELARLSKENRELRTLLSAQRGEMVGLSFDELVTLLGNSAFELSEYKGVYYLASEFFEEHLPEADSLHDGYLFEAIQEPVGAGAIDMGRDDELLDRLVAHGLLEHDFIGPYKISEAGRQFRNRLLLQGSLDHRLDHLWGRAGNRV